MTTERLKYVFEQITDKERLFAGYATPWIYEDSRIYATNGLPRTVKQKLSFPLSLQKTVTIQTIPSMS